MRKTLRMDSEKNDTQNGSTLRQTQATNLLLETPLKEAATTYAKDKRQSLSAVVNEVLEERLTSAGYIPAKRA